MITLAAGLMMLAAFALAMYMYLEVGTISIFGICAFIESLCLMYSYEYSAIPEDFKFLLFVGVIINSGMVACCSYLTPKK